MKFVRALSHKLQHATNLRHVRINNTNYVKSTIPTERSSFIETSEEYYMHLLGGCHDLEIFFSARLLFSTRQEEKQISQEISKFEDLPLFARYPVDIVIIRRQGTSFTFKRVGEGNGMISDAEDGDGGARKRTLYCL